MAGKPFILIALTAALSAAAAVAADPPAQAQDERRICRGGTKQLSSRIRTARRCLTAEQWQQEDEARARVPLSAQVTAGQNDGRQGAQPR